MVRNASVPQTLSVLSAEPETMVLPSGEKATEATALLCALCFSALSSREAAAGRGAVSFGLRVQGYQCPRTRIPDFDGLVVGARDDGLAVGREGHGVNVAAVRALLFRLELKGSCRKHRSSQVWAKGWRVSANTPASQTLTFG